MLATPRTAIETLTRIVTDTLADVKKREGRLVPLLSATGHTLSHDVIADRDQPPFPRAAMDGIAVPENATVDIGITFRKIGEVAAGADPARFERRSPTDDHNGSECIEIMTGAPVPAGYGRVIRFEDISRTDIDGVTTYTIQPGYKAKDHIHPQGADYIRETVILKSGTRLSAPHLAVLASCGYAEVPVFPKPSIAVLGTGDEIVPPDVKPLSYQIRGSNPWTISGELSTWGFTPDFIGLVRDDRDEVRKSIARLLTQHDIVLISGAVSKGTYDFVPEILAELGVETEIHGVRQRPGKPLLIGRREATTVLGLPGNPVSSLVAVRRYLVPQLVSSYGTDRELAVRAAVGYGVRTTDDVQFDPPLTWFPVVDTTETDDGDVTVTIRRSNGSGDFFHVVGSSGFIEVPEERRTMPAGSVVRFFPWGW